MPAGPFDGHEDGPRRLVESLHLAHQLDAGPVRAALLESVSMGALDCLSRAISSAQAALAATRDRRFDQALVHFIACGVESREALTVSWGVDGPVVQPGPAAQRRYLGELRKSGEPGGTP